MLTFREFYEICEGKRPNTPPHAVSGTYKEVDGVRTYTLQKYAGPAGKPTKKEVNKLIVKRSGGGEVKKELKRREKAAKRIEEDIEQRRVAARQQTIDRETSAQQSVQSYHAGKAEAEKKQKLKQEIKRELQTEQTPVMKPNLYNQLIARRQASQKSAHIKHVHSELGAEARAQQAQKRAEMKAIMSR